MHYHEYNALATYTYTINAWESIEMHTAGVKWYLHIYLLSILSVSWMFIIFIKKNECEYEYEQRECCENISFAHVQRLEWATQKGADSKIPRTQFELEHHVYKFMFIVSKQIHRNAHIGNCNIVRDECKFIILLLFI